MNTSKKDGKWNLKLINYLFYYIYYYISVLPAGVHSTRASPASTRTSHLWFHNGKLAQRILDPRMTFEYHLAIENTQRTKPSWQRMNKLTN